MKMELARSMEFQCAHSYQVKEWSEKENLKEFGACFSPTGHGHRYRLEIFVRGEVHPTTGMIINLRDLDLILKNSVSSLEGKFLDKEVPEFLNQIPTTENIASYLFGKVEKQLPEFDLTLSRLRLFETEDLWVECTP